MFKCFLKLLGTITPNLVLRGSCVQYRFSCLKSMVGCWCYQTCAIEGILTSGEPWGERFYHDDCHHQPPNGTDGDEWDSYSASVCLLARGFKVVLLFSAVFGYLRPPKSKPFVTIGDGASFCFCLFVFFPFTHKHVVFLSRLVRWKFGSCFTAVALPGFSYQ